MTVSSSTDIGNLTMDMLSGETVQDIDNPSNATESLLNRWYTQSRRKLLRKHTWNFAEKRATLAASTTAPAFGYTKSYPLPAGFLRVNYLEDGNGSPVRSEDYTIDSTGILYSPATGGSLRLIYTADITDVNKFDPFFVDLLAVEIANRIAYKVVEDKAIIPLIREDHREMSLIAMAIDGQENPPKRIEVSKSRGARRNPASRQPHLVS